MPFRPEYLDGILPLNPVRVIYIVIEIQAEQDMKALQIRKVHIHDTVELVD
jgi:hypothetical protein